MMANDNHVHLSSEKEKDQPSQPTRDFAE
jgi:hypothetical protein